MRPAGSRRVEHYLGGRDVKVHRVTLIPGDGIGPEITEATRRMIEASGVDIEWEVVECGEGVKEREGTVCPDYVLDSVKRTGVALKGPMIVPKGGEYVVTHWTLTGRSSTPRVYPSVNNAIRRALECGICLRLADSLPGVSSRYSNIHIAIVRELDEDVYVASEYAVGGEYAVALKVITRNASENAARFAFEFARENRRRKVTAVHKANILKQTDGLFLETCRRVAAEYPDIELDDKMVDAAVADLVTKPEAYDVLVMPNQYGDIVSDLCAALVGGLGLSPGVNVGKHAAIYEATHGAAPDIAGKGVANPTALMLSGVMMLRRLGEQRAADICERAIHEVLAEGKHITRDLGGNASTAEYTDAVVARIAKLR
ncbi:MAG: isocitrate/isopropylmalate dehydrogenase family protein [Synergistales bacterium]|nr:isocitrate/isopropylmalate dehydrogenase family protein [Synergistales bacterium]